MNEEIPVDAEGSTRNKNYSPQEHLRHLLKIGYSPDSVVVKHFVGIHQLDNYLSELLSKPPTQ